MVKENPGAVGYGGVCRNAKREILQIFYGSIGFDTNNSTELEGMIRGLNLVVMEGWILTMVERDLNILIPMEN